MFKYLWILFPLGFVVYSIFIFGSSIKNIYDNWDRLDDEYWYVKHRFPKDMTWTNFINVVFLILFEEHTTLCVIWFVVLVLLAGILFLGSVISYIAYKIGG